jgi:branched-chain amino acid transport system ATP-binding protein
MPTDLSTLPQEPGVAKPDPILVVDDMRKRFGGIVAVDVDHLEVQRGIVTALIGPNGAGKTTFFNVLTGFDRPDSGHAEFDGQSIDNASPHKLAQRGMVRTFQLTKSLTKLPVIENMKLGATQQRGENFARALVTPLWSAQEAEIEKRGEALLDRFNLAHMRDEYAGSLSGGQRKLLEMSRALMADPRLVMLDEPMAGVNPALKQSLLNHVRGLKDEGISVVFVEHDMDVVQGISDWVVVMALGAIIAEGPPDAIAQNELVIDAYLGAHHDEPLDIEEAEAWLRDENGEEE